MHNEELVSSHQASSFWDSLLQDSFLGPACNVPGPFHYNLGSHKMQYWLCLTTWRFSPLWSLSHQGCLFTVITQCGYNTISAHNWVLSLPEGYC